MESAPSIAKHKEFIQHYYRFRINLQCVKNHHDERNFRQAQSNAIKSFKKIMEIANREANGCGPLRHDFESWLLWNYDLNQEHCNLLLNEQLEFSETCIDELMIEIRKKKEAHSANVLAALTEYEHAKGTLTRRKVRENQAKYVTEYFCSILRKVLSFDTVHTYEMHIVRLEEELKYIIQRMQEINFPRLGVNLQTEWQTFEKNVQDARRSSELQNEEIKAAFELCALAEKRTFLQQMAQKIGEIYESIRDQLRQIRNNAFTLKEAFLNPVLSPAESLKNIFHVFCQPLQTAKVAWEYVKENPGKAAILVIGTSGISLAIGAAVGVVGTALATGAFAVTVADFVVGGIAGSAAFAGVALTAVGGRAARESALAASNAVDTEIMLRKLSLDQLDREEEQYRKRAREAMREQRKKDEAQRRGKSYELLNSDATNTNSQHEPSTIMDDHDRLGIAAQEMQFAKEDLSRALVETYQEERDVNDHLDNIIRQIQLVKEAIEQNQKNTVKTEAKQLVSILNEEDRFDDAGKILDALKNQDYNKLVSLLHQLSLQNNLTEDEVNESPTNDNADDLE